ncbi:MAG: HlyD family efflux transporter periplasmic adaptor subunit [Legionellales bacterium]|nr:HlyD family efflux transporter periplasmic adaptor subunit [Legionellales bacterium]
MLKVYYKLVGLVAVIFFLVLTTCNDQSDKLKPHEIVVQAEQKNHSMFYVGKIEPVVISTVSSPIEGVIKKVYVTYGEKVSKGQVLFELESNAADDNTADTIVNYLKNRDQTAIAENKLKNEEKLWNAGVIAKNDYTDAKRKRDLDYIDFIKSKAKVQDLLDIIGMDISELNSISLDDIAAITKLINMHNNIPIRATNDGVFLKSSGKDSLSILPGNNLEKGIVTGAIAHADQVKINIAVPEVDINKIKVGQDVSITGDGFNDIILDGKVAVVNLYKFDDESSSGEVAYPVEVIVPNFNEQVRDIVHVGMSAKVEIRQKFEGKFFIPLNAIKMQHGHASVLRKDSSGKLEKVIVVLGRTTLDTVEVSKGLTSGDRITYYD